jgi:hypothetical protein
MLIVDRGSRAREIIDFVHFDEERECNIVPEELEAWIIAMLGDIFLAPGEQIVDAQDVTTLLK